MRSQLLVKCAHLLLCFQMLMEIQKLLPQLRNDLNFVKQDLVQVLNVFFDVTAWFINYIEQTHFIFDYGNYFVDVLPMSSYQILFLL
jgi:hypothetical protein